MQQHGRPVATPAFSENADMTKTDQIMGQRPSKWVQP